MQHCGYKIVKAAHPIRMNPSRMTYDVMRGDEVLKANFASTDCAKFFIDAMVRAGFWPDLGKEKQSWPEDWASPATATVTNVSICAMASARSTAASAARFTSMRSRRKHENV